MTFEEWYREHTKRWYPSSRSNHYSTSRDAWDASRAATLAEVAKWHEEQAKVWGEIAKDEREFYVSDARAEAHRVSAARFREIGGST